MPTRAWINVLAGRASDGATRCVGLIEAGEPVALTDSSTPNPLLHADADFDRTRLLHCASDLLTGFDFQQRLEHR